MKLTKADQIFSLCIRERAGWKCEYCNKEYPSRSQGLHCAHFQGRGAWGTRFEPHNCFALCYAHHVFLDSRKGTFSDFFLEKRGMMWYEIIMEKSENIELAKLVRLAEKSGELATFYKERYTEMLQARAGGIIGWLPFAGWA